MEAYCLFDQSEEEKGKALFRDFLDFQISIRRRFFTLVSEKYLNSKKACPA
jgi:hypothetical protein